MTHTIIGYCTQENVKQIATETAHSRLKKLWIQMSNQTGKKTLHPTEAKYYLIFIPTMFL